MNLVACRYNPNHRMKQTRLLIHEDSCPDRVGKTLKMCPYNPIHKVSPQNYERHKEMCDQRPRVDPEVENELKEYLKHHRNANESNWPNNSMSRLPTKYGNVNIGNVSNMSENSTVGLRQTPIDKKQKKELKSKQKEMMNLYNNSEFEEIQGSNFEEIENDFININAVEGNEDKQSMNTLNLCFDSSHFIKVMDRITEQAEYDPNQSDIFITKENKNAINGESEISYFNDI